MLPYWSIAVRPTAKAVPATGVEVDSDSEKELSWEGVTSTALLLALGALQDS